MCHIKELSSGIVTVQCGQFVDFGMRMDWWHIQGNAGDISIIPSAFSTYDVGDDSYTVSHHRNRLCIIDVAIDSAHTSKSRGDF